MTHFLGIEKNKEKGDSQTAEAFVIKIFLNMSKAF
jgi:hypothetical protein